MILPCAFLVCRKASRWMKYFETICTELDRISKITIMSLWRLEFAWIQSLLMCKKVTLWSCMHACILQLRNLFQNRPFYSFRHSGLAFGRQQGWGWPALILHCFCCVNHDQVVLMLTMCIYSDKSREVCIKARWPPALLAFKGPKEETVKWSLWVTLGSHFQVNLFFFKKKKKKKNPLP